MSQYCMREPQVLTNGVYSSVLPLSCCLNLGVVDKLQKLSCTMKYTWAQVPNKAVAAA